MKRLLGPKRQERLQRYDQALLWALVGALSAGSLLCGLFVMVVSDSDVGIMLAPFLVLIARGPMNNLHQRWTAQKLDELLKEELAEAPSRGL